MRWRGSIFLAKGRSEAAVAAGASSGGGLGSGSFGIVIVVWLWGGGSIWLDGCECVCCAGVWVIGQAQAACA